MAKPLPKPETVVRVFTDLFKRQYIEAEVLWAKEPEVVLVLLSLKVIRWVKGYYIPDVGPSSIIDRALNLLKQKMTVLYHELRMSRRFFLPNRRVGERVLIILNQLKEDPLVQLSVAWAHKGECQVLVHNATQDQLNLATRLITEEGLGKVKQIDVNDELEKLGIPLRKND